MNQGECWKNLKSSFLAQFPKGHIERVESLLGRGIPDVTWCADGREGWVEIKTGYQTPSDLQRAWIDKRRAAGGRVAVLTVRPTKAMGTIFPSGHKAFIELNIGEEVISHAPLDWAKVISVLIE